MPPKTMAAICANGEVANKTMSAAVTAIKACARSGHSVRAIPHPPYGLRDDCDGNEFQSMKKSCASWAGDSVRAIGEEDEDERRRQGEPRPRRETAGITGPHQTNGKSHLAARRAGQKLAQADEIRIGALIKPPASDDKFIPEIPDMRDRSAKAGNAQPEEDQENLAW